MTKVKSIKQKVASTLSPDERLRILANLLIDRIFETKVLEKKHG